MRRYYAKRALEIFREEGFIELFKQSLDFIFWQQLVSKDVKFKLYTGKNRLLNHVRYDAPPNPYKPISVDVNEIKYQLRDRITGKKTYPMPQDRGLGQTKAGSWECSKHRRSLDSHPKIKGFEQHFVYEKDWERTKYYEYLKTQTREGNHKKRGFESPKEYIDYCFDQYEHLYNNIKRDGYITNHKGKSKWRNRNYISVKDSLEVLVVIDREGSIHFSGGFHRFAIARCLGLEIPVQVVCRHKKWQKLRDEIYNNGLTEEHEELRDHPDLQDVLA